MSWRQLYISIFTGVILGVFCGFWYPHDYPQEKREHITTESHQITPQNQTGVDQSVPEITENPKKNGQMNNETLSSPETKSKIIPDTSMTKPKTTIVREHHNKTLNNFNIMFLGVDNNKLQMVSVYSINKENHWKSGTVFIPLETLVPDTYNQTFEEFFYKNEPEKVKNIIEAAMEIKINYYVKVDRNLLIEIEKYIDPFYIDGVKVDLPRLFAKEVTPEDQTIIALLLKNLTKPSIFFGILPRLVWTGKQYINTDFELTGPNLWMHYQIAKNIDTSTVTKKVLPGFYKIVEHKKIYIPDQGAWWNEVYEVTK